MITKLDRLRTQIGERATRQGNLDYLNCELQKARDLLAVIPADSSSLEAAQERRIVLARIRQLSDLAADEQRAYEATFGDEQTAADVVEKMSL